METFANSTCILFTSDGRIISSDREVTRHNEAIANCSKKIGIEIDPMQSMKTMLEELTKKTNCFILLNAGMITSSDGTSKKTGFLALPDKFKETQLENIRSVLALLENYESVTTWKLINNNLKTIYNIETKDLIESMIEDTNRKLDSLSNRVK